MLSNPTTGGANTKVQGGHGFFGFWRGFLFGSWAHGCSFVRLLYATTPEQDQVNDNQKNDSDSATSAPLIVTVVASTSAEQKQENDE